jgi:hypothetical protein
MLPIRDWRRGQRSVVRNAALENGTVREWKGGGSGWLARLWEERRWWPGGRLQELVEGETTNAGFKRARAKIKPRLGSPVDKSRPRLDQIGKRSKIGMNAEELYLSSALHSIVLHQLPFLMGQIYLARP